MDTEHSEHHTRIDSNAKTFEAPQKKGRRGRISEKARKARKSPRKNNTPPRLRLFCSKGRVEGDQGLLGWGRKRGKTAWEWGRSEETSLILISIWIRCPSTGPSFSFFFSLLMGCVFPPSSAISLHISSLPVFACHPQIPVLFTSSLYFLLH